MKRTALVLVLTLTAVISTTKSASAQTAARAAGIAIPVVSTVEAAAFSGTFTLKRFVGTRAGVVAVGTLSGIAVPAGGAATSIFRNISVPVAVSPPGGIATAAPGDITIAAVCPILHLDLGPLFLDVLGLQVDLSPVTLDISAVSGAGNLLGNLLCAVTNLLNSPGLLANLLNQILALL
jgi:hypothetical protein